MEFSQFTMHVLYMYFDKIVPFVISMFVIISTPMLDAEAKKYAKITLDDLARIETLGMGGFGRVELVMLIIYY